MTKRRSFSDKFKATLALEALRGDKTAQEIAAKHKVHPKQIETWKRQAIDHCPAAHCKCTRGGCSPNIRSSTAQQGHAKHDPERGSRQITAYLPRNRFHAGRHRVRRLMGIVGLQAIYKEPNTF